MDVAVGGSATIQVWVGVVGSMITLGFVMAIYNIKRLQIDLHRAWMLRVWTWAASIASIRLIQLAGLHCTKAYGYVFHESFKCAEIFFMYQFVGVPDQGNPTGKLYPQCNKVHTLAGVPTPQTINPAVNTGTYVSVSSAGTGPESQAAIFHNLFPMSAWLALFIHALAVETYLWLTPAEHYRLRNVSYEKQIEKGYRVTGAYKDAGLTSTRIGDAPEWWSVPSDEYNRQKRLHHGEDKGDNKYEEEPREGGNPEPDSDDTLTRSRSPPSVRK